MFQDFILHITYKVLTKPTSKIVIAYNQHRLVSDSKIQMEDNNMKIWKKEGKKSQFLNKIL